MTWSLAASAAVGAGSWALNKYAGGKKGGDGGGDGMSLTGYTVPVPVKLPDYPEAEGARTNWWDTLQKWSTQPGYGAIQPNWNTIWTNAADKVRRYFTGGPEGPGAISAVKANLAARGASEDPAAEASLSRLGMQQGNLLNDMATSMATKEADISEKGRYGWLASLQDLAGLKPAYAIGTEVYGNAPMDPVATTAGSLTGGALMDFIGNLFNSNSSTPTTSTSTGSEDPLNGYNSDTGLISLMSQGGADTGIGDLTSNASWITQLLNLFK